MSERAVTSVTCVCIEQRRRMKWLAFVPIAVGLFISSARGDGIMSDGDVDDYGTNEDTIHFLLYERGSDDYKELNISEPFTDEMRRSYGFDPNKKTKILIHGWMSSGTNYFCKQVKDAYMKNHDYNIISVDWSDFSVELYTLARIAVDIVGPAVANLYDYVIQEMGANQSDIHVVGHSLGAHVAGIAAKNMKSSKLGRITGLDPALPLFFLGENRLDSADANFVDVIHTSILGFRKPIGHADFYPNGDLLQQPGCGLNIAKCAHDRAYQYYIESISSKIGFKSEQCPSWHDFTYGNCRGNQIVLMGEPLDERTRGIFYLRTYSSSPYAIDYR